MPRRRVLHLADSPYVGGVTSHILSVAEAFRDDPDWEIVLATLPGKRVDRTMFVRIAVEGFEVSTIQMSSTFDLQVRRRLRDFADVNHIAVVHTHGYRGNVIANLSRLPMPVVTTSHGLAIQPSMRMRLWQWAHLRFMREQRQVIACSSFLAEQLRAAGVPERLLTVVRNACAEDPGDLSGLPRLEYGIDADAIVFLYVGRLDAGKHLEFVIAAMDGRPHYHLVVVGDGPERASLERRVSASSVKASFIGTKQDPRRFYALADIVVLPTEMEALPMTLIEAAAFGKPAIASNVGGVPEVIVDGETGILVNDPDEWPDALTRLSNVETRARMGAAARERHRELFSLEVLRRSLADVYRSVTAH